MGFIHILPDLLVNRIAAGEVIERPASVVKELLENSIDAEATRIEVAIEEGGRRLVRVTDNGIGMGADDLALSVVPHATSKIRHEEDLFAIGTLGFRGEALASIAAVSDLRIVSRLKDASDAYEVRATGDRAEGPRAVGAPAGTTVEVRELFYNVPARQKFLRTAQTEFGHIVEQVGRLALAHPRIEFRLTHNGREVHRLPPTDSLRERIADFYGHELAEPLIPVERFERGIHLTGLISPPAQSRSTGRWEYTFLNGRYIRDRFVQHAVREAYRGLIDPQRYPVTFLMLRMDPGEVDVNVHPTKIEVRWRDSGLIHSLVLTTLRELFLQRDLSVPLTTGSPDEEAERRRQQIRQAIADFFKSHPAPPAQPALPFHQPQCDAAQAAPLAGAPSGREPPGAPPDRAGSSPHVASIAEPASSPFSRMPPEEADAASAPGPPRVIQIHRSYLVAETPDGLIIVDQHALHERIVYEQLRAQVSRGPLESQRLLLPESVDVPGDLMAVLETHEDLLRRIGLELTPFGHGTVAVHACPSILRDPGLAGFVRDLLDKLAARPAGIEPEVVLEELLQLIACKAAVKAGDPLTTAEMQSLLSQREAVERSSNCPHGRPTTLRLTVEELERQFRRT